MCVHICTFPVRAHFKTVLVLQHSNQLLRSRDLVVWLKLLVGVYQLVFYMK